MWRQNLPSRSFRGSIGALARATLKVANLLFR